MEAQLYLSYSYRGGLGYDNRFPKNANHSPVLCRALSPSAGRIVVEVLKFRASLLHRVYFQESSHHGFPQLQGSKHPPVKAQNTSPPPPPPP